MKLRDLLKMATPNDGRRTLIESIMVPEIARALADWVRVAGTDQMVLVGGLALSYYAKPRATQDIDFLFLSPTDVPAKVKGFKRTRPNAFQHNRTHVMVEIVTGPATNVPDDIVTKVFDTANVQDGVRVASPTGLVALKLFRQRFQDKADIIAMIQTGQVDLSGWPLTKEQFTEYDQLVKQAEIEAR